MFDGIRRSRKKDFLQKRKKKKRQEEREKQIEEEKKEKKKKQEEILFQQKKNTDNEEERKKKIDQNESKEKKDFLTKERVLHDEPNKRKYDKTRDFLPHQWSPKEEKKDPIEENSQKREIKKRQETPTFPPTPSPKKQKEKHPQVETQEKKRIEKEERKDELLEYQVIRELERLLKNCNYELKQLYIEESILSKEVDKSSTEKDLDYILNEIDNLLLYLKKIRNQLEPIQKSYDLDQIYQLHNKELTQLIEEYKQQVKSQKQIEGTLSDIKRKEEYTSLIKRIIQFERMQDELRQRVEEKKQQMALREEDFQKAKEEFLKIDEAKTYINSYIKDSERKIHFIEERINEAVDITTKTEIKLHYSLEAIVKTMILLRMIRKNPMQKANGLAAIQTLMALDLIKNLLTPEQRQINITTYHLTDYRDFILNSLNDVSEIQRLITNGLYQIKDLRSYIEKQFGEYKNEIREYNDLLSSMDRMEIELTEREYNINHIQSEMQNQLETNNYKVLRYQNLEEKEEVV